MNEIVKYPNETLREISKEVSLPLSEEDKTLLNEMYRYVKNSDNAVGLSAIQVGVPKRLCAIKFEGFAYKLANPKVISHSQEKDFMPEGCLSVDEEHKEVIGRYKSIKVMGYDLITNKTVVITAVGYMARILQHEIDHMDGKLFIDYIK